MTTPRELLNDGQEEVFSRTAIERGLTKDPLALDPAEIAEVASENKRPEPQGPG